MTRASSLDGTRFKAAVSAAVVSALVATFGFIQNNTGARGGDIAVAKVLWLNLAILAFIVIPLVLSRSASLTPHLRRCFGLFGVSFAVRGVIELVVLYRTDAWLCVYGITHDVITAGVVVPLWWFTCSRHRARWAWSDGLLLTTVMLCLVEAGFAAAFCAVADPSKGWFANSDVVFETILRATWLAVLIGYPLYGFLFWKSTQADNHTDGHPGS